MLIIEGLSRFNTLWSRHSGRKQKIVLSIFRLKLKMKWDFELSLWLINFLTFYFWTDEPLQKVTLVFYPFFLHRHEIHCLVSLVKLVFFFFLSCRQSLEDSLGTLQLSSSQKLTPRLGRQLQIEWFSFLQKKFHLLLNICSLSISWYCSFTF